MPRPAEAETARRHGTMTCLLGCMLRGGRRGHEQADKRHGARGRGRETEARPGRGRVASVQAASRSRTGRVEHDRGGQAHALRRDVLDAPRAARSAARHGRSRAGGGGEEASLCDPRGARVPPARLHANATSAAREQAMGRACATCAPPPAPPALCRCRRQLWDAARGGHAPSQPVPTCRWGAGAPAPPAMQAWCGAARPAMQAWRVVEPRRERMTSARAGRSPCRGRLAPPELNMEPDMEPAGHGACQT